MPCLRDVLHGPSKPKPRNLGWDTFRYVLVDIWNLPKPSQLLFGAGDVGHGGRHILVINFLAINGLVRER